MDLTTKYQKCDNNTVKKTTNKGETQWQYQ